MIKQNKNTNKYNKIVNKIIIIAFNFNKILYLIKILNIYN